jgi:hypothetical protein
MSSEEKVEQALAALKGEDPEVARAALRAALTDHPERMDLVHALAVTELRLGDPHAALDQARKGKAMAEQRDDEASAMLMPQFLLVQAAACEDLPDPVGAEASFLEILRHEPTNPRAQQGLGHLYMAWGRSDDGLAALDQHEADATDEPDVLDATAAFREAARQIIADDIHPKMLLEAHRGAYVEFFDHHATQMAEKGWIAEAARMMRTEEGDVVNSIPEGARPYAAVRVDLVDPSNGQGGQVGDRPMVVALAGYEALAQAPVLVSWPTREHPFGLWISSQVPWDQLSVQIAFEPSVKDPIAVVDPVIGDWYTAGFDGAFGSQERGRFHYISDPQSLGPHAVQYDVDAGRAQLDAITDLLRRLLVLHDRAPISAVLLGRGYLPT